MKTSLLALLLLSFHISASTTVVSDLDDTIKITNAGDLGEASRNGVFSMDVFTGMPEFLNQTRSYAQTLYVLSASPTVLAPRVSALLRKHRIENDGVFLRNPVRENSKTFKLRVLKDLMSKSQDDFLFFGDDVDHDPEIYGELLRLYPERVLGIYIRAVRNRDVPESVTKYWTSFDLTLREVLAGRMAVAAIGEMVKVLLQEAKLKYIFPKFAHCPSDATVWIWQTQTIFSAEAGPLSEKLLTYCRERKPNLMSAY